LGTAPLHGRGDSTRLAVWLAVVFALIALQYASRFTSSSSQPAEPLYSWTFFAGAIGQELVFLLIVLAIAGFTLRRFALRRPRSATAALRLIGISFVTVIVFEIVYDAIVRPGNEQKLTPTSWEPKHAAAYIANGIVVCTLVPFVEELTFRGLGYSLLEPYGERTAIVVIAVLFGLSHGLVLELPIIVVFGGLLAWVRARTGSVFPGMLLHATFNLVALVLAVTLGG
jgi:membrane protease YdiL (CAAX protease family)